MANNKSKKKNGKTKPKRAKKASGKNIGIKSGSSPPVMPYGPKPKQKPNPTSRKAIHEGICSVTDPFCYKAKNSKWPDGQGGGTVAYQVRGRVPSSVLGPIGGTGGGTLLYFSANLPFTYLTSASYSGGNYTMATGYSKIPGIDTIFTSAASTYRPTSWGIIIRNIQPATAAQGLLVISKQTAMPPVNQVEAAGATIGAEVQVYPLCAGLEVAVIGKTLGTEGRKFFSQNTATTFTPGWDVIKVEVTGGAATGALIDIEFVSNVEFTLVEAQVGMHQFIRPDVANAPQTVAASTKVMANLGSIVEGGVEKMGAAVLAHASSAVEDILSSGLAWLGI